MPAEHIVDSGSKNAVEQKFSFKDLSEQLGRTADSGMKAFLSEILKASEATLFDLHMTRDELEKLREKLDRAEAATAEIAGAEAKRAKEIAVKDAKMALRAAAQAAGAIEIDDVLAFVSVDEIQLNGDGKGNAEALVESLKKAKPHLFTRLNTSAAKAAPRNNDASGPRNALAMTAAEYKAARNRFIRR